LPVSERRTQQEIRELNSGYLLRSSGYKGLKGFKVEFIFQHRANDLEGGFVCLSVA
jgi:hypothetical protein